MPRSLRKPSYIPSNPIEIFFPSIQISLYLNFINLGTSPPWCVNFQLKSPNWSKSAKNFVFSVQKRAGGGGGDKYLLRISPFPPPCHAFSPVSILSSVTLFPPSLLFIHYFFPPSLFFIHYFFPPSLFFSVIAFFPSVIAFFSSRTFSSGTFFHPFPFSTISSFLPNVSLKLGSFTPGSSNQEI